jgi:cytidine deaminase
MKNVNITLNINQLELSELNELELKVLSAAKTAADTAYAPFSNFNVGAAVLLENGEIISASNQENSAYPSGLCAERVALFYAGARFPGIAILMLFIVVKSSLKQKGTVYAPCGACRQVISESEYRQETPIHIYFEGPDSYFTKVEGICEIMPYTFHLKK